MQFITQFLHQIVSALLGFWQQTEQSRWFPLLVGAVAVSIVLGIINFGISMAQKPTKKRMPFSILWIEFRFLVTGELIPIICLWLALATPFDRLPFGPPSTADHWLFFPALAAYTVIAVLTHGILSLYGVFILASGWLTQLRTPDYGRLDFMLLAVGLLVVVWVWEAQGWPELFLVTFELLLAVVVAILLGAAVVGRNIVQALNNRQSPSSEARTALRTFVAVYSILIAIFLLLIVLWHEISWYVVTLAAVYYVLTLLDSTFIVCFATDSYRRAFVLFPLTLALTFATASGLVRQVTHNSGVTYTLWLEVGVAAAAYMLLFPLTEMARKAVRVGLLAEARRQFALSVLESIASAGPKDSTESPAVAPGERVIESAPAKQQTEAESKTQRAVGAPRMPIAIGAVAQEVRDAAKGQAQVAYEALNARVWIILLFAALIFHYFAGFPDVLAGLGGNLLTVVFGALSLFAGILAVLASQNNAPARDVLLLVLMLTMGVIAGDVMLNYVPIASGAVSVAPSGLLTAILDQHYVLATLHSMFQEMLFLLAIGQITYLIIVVNANLRRYEETTHEAL